MQISIISISQLIKAFLRISISGQKLVHKNGPVLKKAWDKIWRESIETLKIFKKFESPKKNGLNEFSKKPVNHYYTVRIVTNF